MQAPVPYYQARKNKFNSELTLLTQQRNRIANIRLLAGTGAAILVITAINTGNSTYYYVVAALAIVFLILVRRHMMVKDKIDRVKMYLTIIEGETEALNGNYKRFQNGAQFLNATHPYTYDLDVFGDHSLFQMLNRTVTFGGNDSLAGMMMNGTTEKTTIEDRQAIIKELSQNPEFLEDFRVEGMRVNEDKNHLKRLREWLIADEMFAGNQFLKIAGVVMPVLALGAIAYSVALASVWVGLWGVVVANWLILGNQQKKIKTAAQQIGNTAALMQLYEALLRQVASNKFEQPWLKAQQELALNSLEQMTAFRKLVQQFEGRNNGMVGPLMNTLFLFDIICLLRLEKWKKHNRATLINATESIIALDALISCSVHAFNHPEYTYPQFNDQKTTITATDLRHPLLNAQTAVGNSFTLGIQEQFYLLTGANMTGKSTFIRTIGVSVVLANLGLPLFATAVTMPVARLYTSMRVTDSVQDDISYFKAELNRISNLMQAVEQSTIPYVVLLDEPLRGTNSTDKQQGTRAIVHKLLKYKAIGIVATHDTILCDMAARYTGEINNYHFESTVSPTGLSFDFTLKTGGSTSNNATILMKQMGIIE